MSCQAAMRACTRKHAADNTSNTLLHVSAVLCLTVYMCYLLLTCICEGLLHAFQHVYTCTTFLPPPCSHPLPCSAPQHPNRYQAGSISAKQGGL